MRTINKRFLALITALCLLISTVTLLVANVGSTLAAEPEPSSHTYLNGWDGLDAELNKAGYNNHRGSSSVPSGATLVSREHVTWLYFHFCTPRDQYGNWLNNGYNRWVSWKYGYTTQTGYADCFHSFEYNVDLPHGGYSTQANGAWEYRELDESTWYNNDRNHCNNTVWWYRVEVMRIRYEYRYTLTLNANGGSVSPTSRVGAQGSTYILPTPTRTGYTFTGWTRSGGGSLSGSVYTYGSSNGTVTANWSTNTTEPTTTTANPATTTTPTTIPIPTTTSPTTTTTTTNPTTTTTNNLATTVPTTSPTTTTYPLQTTTSPPDASTYDITFDTNNGANPTVQTKLHDMDLVLGFEPTRSGYTFLGWAVSADATTAQYLPGGIYTANASVTLYAVWTPNAAPQPGVYAIHYNDGTNEPQIVTFPGDDTAVTVTLSNVAPVREGYKFLGWLWRSTIPPHCDAEGNLNAGNVLKYLSTIKSDGTVEYGIPYYQPGDLFTCERFGIGAIWNLTPGWGKIIQVTYDATTNGGQALTNPTTEQWEAIDLTRTASKPGWEFIGWNTDKDATAGLPTFSIVEGTGNVTLYAIYKKTQMATFIDYNGTTKTTRTAESTIYNNATSGSVAAPAQNTFTGWTSRGWSTGTAAIASAAASPLSISADTTFYGLYQRTLTLSYNANGGSSTPGSQSGTQYVNSYENTALSSVSLTLAPTITRSGYTFSKWAKDSAAGTQYAAEANIDIDKDTTMYAVWEAAPVDYTVTLDRQGGTGGSASVTATYGATMPSAAMPTRTGYTFAGYYDAASGGTQYYTATGTSARTWNKTADATLYARWTANTYTVTLDRQGSTGGSASLTATYGAAMPTATMPTRTGYTFAGYYDAASGGTQYYTATGASARTWNKDTAATLYARWTAKTYTVTLDMQGGAGGSASVVATYDANMPAATMPTRAGYTFAGYYDAASGGTQYYTATGASARTWNKDAAATLYARWTSVPVYTVTFDKQGGTGGSASVTATYDAAMPSATMPTREGYTFAGYYDATSGGTQYYTATGASARTWNKAAAATLYARWTTKTYTVTFDKQGGSGGTNNVTATYDAAMPAAAMPTRTGYTFAGYYDAISGGTQYYTSTGTSARTWNKDSAATLYARWNIPNTNIYNLGEETYSFKNYGDSDSSGGHCFGMSVTSGGYYLRRLDISIAGGNYANGLYALSSNETVKAPICKYQKSQTFATLRTPIVAGDSYDQSYQTSYDIQSDWLAVMNYVKGHSYDGKGNLHILIWVAGGGGHAVNFLRYEVVSGQERIYAYDNNFPTVETYFYKDASGKVRQAPSTFGSYAIDSIGLHSTNKFFDVVSGVNATRVLYAEKGSVAVEGVNACLMTGDFELGQRVSYELPPNLTEITITPLVDNASFEYLDKTYSFGEIDDDTIGILTLASGEGSTQQSPSFTIAKKSEPPPASGGNSTASQKTVLTDTTTGVIISAEAGRLPEGTKLNVRKIKDGKVQDDEYAGLFGQGAYAHLYDVTLTKGGKQIQPSDSVTVKIPLPADYAARDYGLYYVNIADNRYQQITPQIEGGNAVFTTDHFSVYGFVSKGTGDSGTSGTASPSSQGSNSFLNPDGSNSGQSAIPKTGVGIDGKMVALLIVILLDVAFMAWLVVWGKRKHWPKLMRPTMSLQLPELE